MSIDFEKEEGTKGRREERWRAGEREIEEERERKRERNMSVVFHICPDWGSNPQPLVYGMTLPLTKPPGQHPLPIF